MSRQGGGARVPGGRNKAAAEMRTRRVYCEADSQNPNRCEADGEAAGAGVVVPSQSASQAVSRSRCPGEMTVLVEFIFRRENLWHESPARPAAANLKSTRVGRGYKFCPFSPTYGCYWRRDESPAGPRATRRFMVWLAGRGGARGNSTHA